MNLLLDTHAFVWWVSGDDALSPRAREAIADPTRSVFVSAATAWELGTKFRIGKLPGVADIIADIEGAVVRNGFSTLAVTMRHGQLAGTMPGEHRDPFDRMLIAQAILEGLTLVSNDVMFDRFGAGRLW